MDRRSWKRNESKLISGQAEFWYGERVRAEVDAAQSATGLSSQASDSVGSP